ncbi:hypothetical protein MG293_012504 [Ovis ammon polii]|uniref:Polypeptide N-acetylgalactosaminyltransferase n=1 Tax=Ovis ammon polii TaxID=230172 RepID=A0AAD4Y8S4_OVIAM|nr:hypothetical protein MG293_012504 [Ovis ammon polii]
MTNIICLLYVGWVTNYIASVYVRGQEPAPDKKLEEDKGDTLKIIERLDHLENVIKQHIQEEDVVLNRLAEVVMGIPAAEAQCQKQTGLQAVGAVQDRPPTQRPLIPLPTGSVGLRAVMESSVEARIQAVENTRIHTVDDIIEASLIKLGVRALFTQEESHSLALSIPEYAQEKIEGEWKDIFPGVNNSSSNKSAIARYSSTRILLLCANSCDVDVMNIISEAPAKPEEAEAEPFTDSSLFAHWGQELSPEGRRVALKQFQYYGYNAYLSDRLPLDRPLPDLRPSGCRNLSFPDSLPEVSIVFIFVNEALSVLLRSIHSAIERTPPHLLKEIILVDDYSSNAFVDSRPESRKPNDAYEYHQQTQLMSCQAFALSESVGEKAIKVPLNYLSSSVFGPDFRDTLLEELKEKLTEYVDKVNGQKPGFIKVVRHSKQEGLIRSRVSGWRAATAPVVALFDAHVEFNVGWAEPVLTRIKENRKRIISPSFDNIKYDNFEIEEYPLAAQGFDWELWCRYLNPPKAWWKLENSTAPIRSPALIGCFIVDRQYFQEIGLLDEGMEVYGGENVELGIRVWQCGGSVEVLPCSRIAHIERAHKPYTEDLTAHVRRNALRVAEVWMDEFKSHVYMAWNIPQEDSGIDIGDITARKALRKQLQCKTFRWYLVSVYPEMRMYSDIIAYGVLQNSLKTDLCLDQGPETENVPIVYICHGMTPQNVYYTSSQQIHVGILSPTVDDDDNRCLVDVNSRPRLIECSYAKAKRMKLHWQFSQGGPIQNRKSKRCLELQENNEAEFGFQLVLQRCSGQHWSITNVLRSLAS